MSSEYGDYRSEPDVEDYLVRMLAREIRDEVQEELGKTGVLSLSQTWSSVLMWSHYGDQHRGICIEYDTTEQVHPRLLPVNYRSPRAIKTSDLIRWKTMNDTEAQARVMQIYFYAKSKEWKYEREWRDLRDKSGSHGVPFRITAIYFGLRCDTSVITSIVKLLVDRPAIKLYQVHPKGDTFKLARSLIEREELEQIGVSDPAFIMFKDVVLEE